MLLRAGDRREHDVRGWSYSSKGIQAIFVRLPTSFYLVPGVGFQGGSLKEISENALMKPTAVLVNASRAIIYASSGENFAQEASEIAKQYQSEMNPYIRALK